MKLRKPHKDALHTLSIIVGPAHLVVGTEPDMAPEDRLHNVMADLVEIGFADSGARDHYTITDAGRAALSLASI